MKANMRAAGAAGLRSCIPRATPEKRCGLAGAARQAARAGGWPAASGAAGGLGAGVERGRGGSLGGGAGPGVGRGWGLGGGLGGAGGGARGAGTVGAVQVDDALVHRWAERPIDRVTITRMLASGENATPERLVVIAQHVHRELTVRLARRLLDLQTLPYVVVINPNIQRVFGLYERAFARLVDCPKVVNISQDQQFVELVKELVAEGVQVVPWLAKGVQDASRKVPASQLNLNRFMSDMIMSRISRRVIAEQFIALHEQRDGYIGVICKDMSPADAVRRVAPEAQATCQRTYGVQPPEVVVEGGEGMTCSYLPTHLDYILFENLKNALRAVVEHGMESRELGQRLPPVRVLIAKGKHDMSIRISDQGGGVPREAREKIFDFGFSTVRHQGGSAEDGFQNTFSIDSSVVKTSPMAGLGFGLPTSRLYAQYFGGDVTLSSMEGYGSDVLIRIDHLGSTEEFEDYDGFDIWKLLRTSADAGGREAGRGHTLEEALKFRPRMETHAYPEGVGGKI